MAKKSKITTKRVLIISFLVDLSDVLMNAVVAVVSGSIVMLAEMLQGIADVAVDLMLLFGFSRSSRRSSQQHPFGFGKEMYFWAIIAAVFIFFVTATLAVYFGLRQILDPEPLRWLGLAYLVLSIATVTNGYSFSISYRRLMNGRPLKDTWRVFVNSSQAATKTIFVSDLMGVLAAITGLIALLVFGVTGNLTVDGVGAVAIGVMLGLLALLLLFGLRDLVTGKSIDPAKEKQIIEMARKHPAVKDILDLKTMIIGPNKILVNLEIHLNDGLSTDEIEEIMDELKANITREMPEVKHIQIELETPDYEL